ncbi:MAG TPA: polysaccharide lyase family 8 super-sandwich domain-containing protein, partial [Oceanipulchritudo sp.]|nr:polysaccharide lyase family 8 super-sandwich domain-containing protein [Oceanipulchritudo sp.]
AIGAVVDRRASKLTSIVEDSFEKVLKVIPYGDNSDGIRVDQTIFSHGPQLYNATYGREFLNSSIRAIDLLKGTPWDQGEEAIALVENQLLGGIRNMSYGNWMDYNTMGRAISRPGSDQLAVGFTSIIKTLLELEPANPGQLEALLTRIEEDSVTVHESAKGIHPYYYGDFITRHGEGYYTSVRMVSERTSYNETGNGEGLKNAHFGDGVNLTLVHGDEYDRMSVLWDYEQLPGITAENNGTETKSNTWADMAKSPYAGSAVRNGKAVSAMGLDHDDVLGWKSWFMLDEGVVALGSTIRSPEGSRRTTPWMPVLTTVNFTKFEDSVSYGTTDEQSGTLTEGEGTNLEGQNWLWHRDIGYLILEEANIAEAEVEPRSGNWSEIGTSSGNVEGLAFKLYFDHGAEPEDGGYAYMTLPNTDQTRTQALAENPPIEILRRDEGVHAVKARSDGSVLAAFFTGGETLDLGTSGSVTVDEPILMLIEKTAGLYEITVSDPRKELPSVTLTMAGELEGDNAVYDPSAGATTLEVELPSGDRTGFSVTQNLKDLGDPAAEWGSYFQDISYSNEEMDFFSERFGWFNGEDWPWVWSFEYERFWFVSGESHGGDLMIWWDPDQEVWVFTNTIFYPWYYNFSSQDWDTYALSS